MLKIRKKCTDTLSKNNSMVKLIQNEYGIVFVTSAKSAIQNIRAAMLYHLTLIKEVPRIVSFLI
jgi:hypothetical protein